MFHAAVDTNNGTESQNKVLKYSYLPRKKNMSLSGIVSLLVESFLTDAYHTYLLKNFQMSDTYCSHNSFVPKYLHNRPRSVIIHCLERKKKSIKFTSEDVRAIAIDQGIFTVQTPSGSIHTINFGRPTGKPSCTCKDWCQWNLPCKHFFAIFRCFENWGWEALPQAYLDGPYLSLDSTALHPLNASQSTEIHEMDMCPDNTVGEVEDSSS